MAGSNIKVYVGLMEAPARPFQIVKNTAQPQAICGRGSHRPIASPMTASGTKTIARTIPASQPVEDDLGHWRNRWDVPARHAHLARRQGALPLGDGTWLGYRRFPTSEAAESEARRFAGYNFQMFGIRYVGPEFFPEY